MTIPTLAIVLSAIVFAPLSSWVASRRGRSRAAWFAFGAGLGPLAILLLLVAPPGRCPDCGARTRGWPRACPGCGYRFTGDEAPALKASSAGSPAVDRTVGGAAPATGTVVASYATAGGSRATTIRPARGSASRTTARQARRAAPAPPIAASSAFPAAAPTATYQPVVDELPTTTMVLGSGVYMGGQAPMRTGASLLQAGSRYVIARDGDELQVLGPVHVDPTKVVARIPLAECEVSIDGGRLMIQGHPATTGLTLSFSATAVSRDLDLAAALAVTDPRGEEAR